MTLHRKYANLPDLDSAPDIYETPSLTSDNSTTFSTDPTEEDDFPHDSSLNENISRQKLDTDSARRVFGGSVVDAGNVDFSERVGGMRKSYVVHSGGVEDEDLNEKIRRLRREVELVKEECEKRREGGESNVAGGDEGVEELVELLQGLSSNGETKTARLMGKFNESAISEEEMTKTEDGETKPRQPQTQDIATSIPPQLDHETARITAFDTRLTELERVLGISSTTIPVLDTHGSPMTILPSLSKLQQKLALLLETSPTSLDAISQRVQALTTETQQLTEARKSARKAHEDLVASGAEPSTSKDKGIDEEYAAKVNALYGTLGTIEDLAPLLPPLLERLRSLRGIHADAAETYEGIEKAYKKQEAMDEELKKWTLGLEKVEEAIKQTEVGMGQNVEIVEGWVKGLEERMNKLAAS